MARVLLSGVLLVALLSGCAAGSSTPGSAGSATGSPTGSPSAAGGRAAETGITGRVVSGPQCPVQQVPPPSASPDRCADRPVQATVQVVDAATGRVAATVHTSSDGRFRILLAPGRYEVQVLEPPSGLRGRPASPVEVSVTGMAEVTLIIDTGIR